MSKMILSRRLVRAKAAMLDKTLEEVGEAAGMRPGQNYIYRVLDSDGVTLRTLDKIAQALGCEICEIIERMPEKAKGRPPKRRKKPTPGQGEP